MSTEYYDFIGPANMLSNCCGARAFGEIDDGCGICSKCHDHASFEKEDEEDGPKNKIGEIEREKRIAELIKIWDDDGGKE